MSLATIARPTFPAVADPNAAPPASIRDIGVHSFAILRDGCWIRIVGYDAGHIKAQVDFLRAGADKAVHGSISAAVLAVRAMPPAEVLGKLADVEAARRAVAIKRMDAMAMLRVGSRVEFDAKGKTIVGTVTRKNTKTVSLTDDNGNEWRCTPGLLRISAAAAPTPLPEHPTMVRWTLGKIRYGLNGLEGRSWEQPLLLDGKRVGVLRDMGDGGSVDIETTPSMLSAQLCADAKQWAAAVGEETDGESFALWAEWTTHERPLGKAYQTLKARFN